MTVAAAMQLCWVREDWLGLAMAPSASILIEHTEFYFAAGHAGVQELIKVLRESRLKIQHGEALLRHACVLQAGLPRVCKD